MNLKLTKIYFSVQDYLMILFGTLLYGFGFNAFILSNEIVTGGVSGICALIFFASNGLIPVSASRKVHCRSGLSRWGFVALAHKYCLPQKPFVR